MDTSETPVYGNGCWSVFWTISTQV